MQLDKTQQVISAGIALPIKADGTRDSVNTSYTHQDVQGQVSRTLRLGVDRTQKVGKFDRILSLQYQHEVRAAQGAPTDNLQALTLNSSWTFRKTNNLLYPTAGYLLNFQLGGALQSLLSDRTFLRTYVKGVRYYSLASTTTAILRIEGGYVRAQSSQGVPSDFLFRTGGDQSVRGYAYQSLGVQDGAAIVGGRYLGVLSSEIDHWWTTNWGSAIFYDAGNAVDNKSALALQRGYGLGLRWRSPVGPVNLDVAYGKTLKKYRLHFSLGFTF